MSKPTFEHRHYKAIAAILADLDDMLTDEAHNMVIERFAVELSYTNPNFNTARFLAAARGEPSNGRDRVR